MSGKGRKGKPKSKAVVSAATARGLAGNKSSARRRNHSTAYGMKKGSEPSTFESFGYDADRRLGAMTERERLDALSAEIDEQEKSVWEYWREQKKEREEEAKKWVSRKTNVRDHACEECGWIARYGEKICGACGRQMFLKERVVTYRIGGRKRRGYRFGEPVEEGGA